MTLGIVVNKKNLYIISLMSSLFLLNIDNYFCIIAVFPISYLFFEIYNSNSKIKNILYLYLGSILFQLVHTVLGLSSFDNHVFQLIATGLMLISIFLTYQDRYFVMEELKLYFRAI